MLFPNLRNHKKFKKVTKRKKTATAERKISAVVQLISSIGLQVIGQQAGEHRHGEFERAAPPQVFAQPADGAGEVLLDGLGDTQPGGYFPVFQPFEAAHAENLAAAVGQCVDRLLHLALQLLVETRLLGVAQEIVAVNTLFAPHTGRILQFVARYDAVVFQIIETAVAHHREQQRRQVQFAQFTPPLPQARKTVLHQVARSLASGDKPGGIVHQSGIITPEKALEIGFVAEFAEIQLLGLLGKGLSKFPELSKCGDYIRDAMVSCISLALVAGSFLAANATWGAVGLMIVGGFFVLNDVTGQRIPKSAVGPLAAVAVGILFNIMIFLGFVAL